jgi:hypothetical protein
MSGWGSVRLEVSSSGEYDDGEVSFRLPQPVRVSSSVRGGPKLLMRRRRGLVVKVESEESGRRRVRVVNSQPDGAASDVSWRRQMGQSVSDRKDGIARLLQQQSCLSQTVVQSLPVSSVLPPVASGGFSSSPGRRPPSKGSTGRCRMCGAAGHFVRDCPKSKSSGDSPASRREIEAGDDDKTEVCRSAELNKGGKISRVNITLDIGIVFSVLPARNVCDSWLRPTEVKLVAANGSSFSVHGRAVVKFSVGALKLCADVLVLSSFDEFLFGLKWLCGREVLVRSDHSALQYLLTSKGLLPQWTRYLDFLSNFVLQLRHQTGCQQQLAGFLSRWRQCEVATQSTCSQCRPKEPRVPKVMRRRRELALAGVATGRADKAHEVARGTGINAHQVRTMGGTGVVTQRCVDRSAESAPGESTGPDSSPVSVTIVAPCAMDGDSWRVPTDPSAGDEHNSGSVRPLEVSAGSEKGPTDQRLFSRPVIAPRSHNRPQEISDLETEGVSHKGSEYRRKTSAVSHDCANDRLIRVVWRLARSDNNGTVLLTGAGRCAVMLRSKDASRTMTSSSNCAWPLR